MIYNELLPENPPQFVVLTRLAGNYAGISDGGFMNDLDISIPAGAIFTVSPPKGKSVGQRFGC